MKETEIETVTPVQNAAESVRTPERAGASVPSSSQRMQLKAVRLVAITEGISLLLLFLVAMPVKYLLGYPVLVRWVGTAHGALFLAFVASLILFRPALRWSWGRVLLGIVASSVPFATFFPYFHAPAGEKQRR